MTYYGTSTAPDDGWQFLSNLEKTKREVVLQAIKESGQSVQWRDAPKEPSRGADIVGSIWSNEPGRDCSRFWEVYRSIERGHGEKEDKA